MPDLNKTHAAAEKAILRMKTRMKSKSCDDHWSAKNKASAVPESNRAKCRACEKVISPRDEEVSCSIDHCEVLYHSRCASDRFESSRSSKVIKCPQHACFLCKKTSSLWRCSKCDLASHDKCAAFPEDVTHSKETPGEIICWRHFTHSPPLEPAVSTSSIKPAVPTPNIKEVFRRLPLPRVEKEFKIDLTRKDTMPDKLEPPSYAQNAVPTCSIGEVFRRLPLPYLNIEFQIDVIRIDTMAKNSRPPRYVKIKENIYRTKNKSCHDVDDSMGCTSCGTGICYEDCICRNTSISCSNACECSETCTNRPFPEDKKVKVVKTQQCGWGVQAAEFINKGDFIIEYVGEVINDNLCEKRFWKMKRQGVTNFYVCEVGKDFNIDGTFKGNESRFVNHSCDPNCEMEKWDINGETRLGMFAAKSIEPGEEIRFDYRFEHFGQVVECHCGASNCRGYIGTKKIHKSEVVDCGAKRRRTAAK